MASLTELQHQLETGHLSLAEFQAQAQALHQQLFALVPALVRSEVHQILIDGDGVRFVMGDEAVALWCPPDDPEAPPLDALNFGAHELDATALINPLAAGARAILMVGAGLGYHALRLAQREAKAQVHAFEPGLRRFEWLSRNLALNALGERVRLYAHALAEANGTLQLRTLAPALTLDTWCAHSGVAPDFIHCAGTGQALHLLTGGAETLARHRPRLFCALPVEREAVLQGFAALGYRAWVLGDYGLQDPADLDTPTAPGQGVFLHPEVHGQLISELTELP